MVVEERFVRKQRWLPQNGGGGDDWMRCVHCGGVTGEGGREREGIGDSEREKQRGGNIRSS